MKYLFTSTTLKSVPIDLSEVGGRQKEMQPQASSPVVEAKIPAKISRILPWFLQPNIASKFRAWIRS